MAFNDPKTEKLLEAVLAEDAARLQALMEQGGDANAKPRIEPTLLEKLGLGFHTDAFAPLLVVAAGLGRVDMVATLLEHGADVRNLASYWSYVVVSANTQTEFPAGNALKAATMKGHQKVIQLLKANGA